MRRGPEASPEADVVRRPAPGDWRIETGPGVDDFDTLADEDVVDDPVPVPGGRGADQFDAFVGRTEGAREGLECGAAGYIVQVAGEQCRDAGIFQPADEGLRLALACIAGRRVVVQVGVANDKRATFDPDAGTQGDASFGTEAEGTVLHERVAAEDGDTFEEAAPAALAGLDGVVAVAGRPGKAPAEPAGLEAPGGRFLEADDVWMDFGEAVDHERFAPQPRIVDTAEVQADDGELGHGAILMVVDRGAEAEPFEGNIHAPAGVGLQPPATGGHGIAFA